MSICPRCQLPIEENEWDDAVWLAGGPIHGKCATGEEQEREYSAELRDLESYEQGDG